MKKLISSILALGMLAGMSVTAFAGAGDILGFNDSSDIDISLGTNKAYNKEYTVTVPYNKLGVEVEKVNATDSTADNASLSQVKAFATGAAELTLTDTGNNTNASVVSIEPKDSGYDVKLLTETSGNANGNAIVLELEAAIPNQVGTVTAAYIPIDVRKVVVTGYFTSTVSGYKINDVINTYGSPIGELGGVKLMGMNSSSIADLDIRPNAEIRMYLVSDDFLWEASDGSTSAVSGAKVTTSQLRTGKITVKKSIAKGSNVIEDITIDSDKEGAYVGVLFVEYFVSTKEQDVDLSVYLAKKGARRSGTEVSIAGTMANDEETVDEGDDYVSTEEGIVVEAQGYVRGIEVYLGNGVTITTNMFKNKRYYGIALNTLDTASSTIMDAHPSIENVITLKTINLKGSGNIVTFDMDEDYYVYSADGTYLGLSSEAVVYSDRYYFSTERLSIADDKDDSSAELPDYTNDNTGLDNENLGGDDGGNANQNPGTGANGFVGVAIAAGLISLAAVGATARKKK